MESTGTFGAAEIDQQVAENAKTFKILNYVTKSDIVLINTVKFRFYVFRFYVEKSDDQIQSFLNSVAQFFYAISRFYDAFAADQKYRSIEI